MSERSAPDAWEKKKSLIEHALALPGVKAAARGASNWVDLQWSLLVAQLAEVAPRAKGALLDVGCGEKPYEHIFTPFVTSYVGIEHEATFAHTTASSRPNKPDLYYDGARLPFPDASFDTVLNVQVLEHTTTPQALMGEMARVLRPGGTLILNAPFCFRLHEEPHDYFRYTPHGLRDMCERAGLEVTDVRAQGSLWSVLGHKLNSFLAFQVAELGGVTQALGKLGHESAATRGPRIWALPVVLPAMACVSGGARILDRVLPDATEALSYLILATRRA